MIFGRPGLRTTQGPGAMLTTTKPPLSLRILVPCIIQNIEFQANMQGRCITGI